MAPTGIIAKILYQPAIVRLWSDRTLHLLGTDVAPTMTSSLDIRINDRAHLERFEQVNSWQPRKAFLADCNTYVENGILIFTIADKTGPLLGYGLADPNSRESFYPYVQQRIVWPEMTGVIYGGFVHPSARGQQMHAALQNARIHHMIRNLGIRQVVSAVESDNQAAIRSARKTPLRPIADLRTRHRFGKAYKTAVQHDDTIALSFDDETK